MTPSPSPRSVSTACLAGLVAVTLAVTGCTKGNAQEAAALEAATTASGASAAAAAAPAAPKAIPSVDPNAPSPGDSLFSRLGHEAASRPKIKPNADDVYAALDKAGVGVPTRKQSLGSTYHATYCTGGYNADASLAVDVCEYADEAAGKAGYDYSKTLFPGMTSRTVVANKATVLVVIDQKSDAATVALRKKVVSAYQAL
jgi:hypothetical protein